MNICSQKIQHMKLKLEMLTGKDNILSSVGRGDLFCFGFNKQHTNERTPHTLELREKSVSDLKEFRPIWGHGCKGQLHLQNYEALKTTRSQDWILRFSRMLRIPSCFYVSARTVEAPYFKQKPFLFP